MEKINKSPNATLKEACEYLRVSYGYGRHAWVEWREKYGVRVSRIGKRLVMPYKDLDSMLSQREVA